MAAQDVAAGAGLADIAGQQQGVLLIMFRLVKGFFYGYKEGP
jgi:hypothetical protein